MNNIQFREDLDQVYLKALLSYEKNKNNMLLNEEESNLLKKINEKLYLLPNDTNSNEINCINSKVYKEYELNGFFSQAKLNKFDFNRKIEDLVKKMLNTIQKNN